MLSVLVISPHPSVPGGVSTFIECMKRHVVGSTVESFYVGNRGDESTLAQLVRLIIVPVKLARLVAYNKFDVVHINPSFNLKALIRDGLLLLALRMTGYRRTLVYFHGWDMSVQRRIINNALLRRITAWILNGAGLVTVLGDTFRDGLIAIGVDPARVSVTRTMFEFRYPREEFVPPERRGILFMSRFDREKGAQELLSAFAALAQDFPDTDLVLAGKGAEEKALRAQAKQLRLEQRVTFPGYVEGMEKWRLLWNCAIFALPTYYRSEGMPVAMLEAMAVGKPLVIGAAGAIRSVVSEPENGIVLNEVTAQTVEAGLRRLLNDTTFCAAAGQRNYQLATAKFDARVVTAEIENFYKQVAQC